MKIRLTTAAVQQQSFNGMHRKRSWFGASILALSISSGIGNAGCVMTTPTSQQIQTSHSHIRPATLQEEIPDKLKTETPPDPLITIVGIEMHKSQLDALNKLASDNTGNENLELQEILNKIKVKDGYVLELDLGETAVKNISALVNFNNLEKLNLKAAYVMNISALANLTMLQELDLSWTGVSDISALINLTNLQSLRLNRTNVTNGSIFSALAKLTNLQSLNLDSTQISNIRVLTNLTKLQWLGLNDTRVSDISALANLTMLQGLGLIRTGVSDISALANLTMLQSLGLSRTWVSDISALINLTELRALNLDDCNQIRDFSILVKLTKLHNLDVRGTQISKKQLEVLRKMPNLESLSPY